MPAASTDLRKELNGAEEDGPEHDARIFGEVTDLFLSNVGRLGDSQIAAVDGVLAHLVGRVAADTVIQLSEALSTIDRAPVQTIRKLAFHEQPQVAAPGAAKLRLPVGRGPDRSRQEPQPAASAGDLRPQDAQRGADRRADAVRRRQRLQRACPQHRRAFLRMRLCDAGRARREGRGAGGKARRPPGHPGQPAARIARQGRRRRSRAFPDGVAAGGAPESPERCRAAARPERRSTTPGAKRARRRSIVPAS